MIPVLGNLCLGASEIPGLHLLLICVFGTNGVTVLHLRVGNLCRWNRWNNSFALLSS